MRSRSRPLLSLARLSKTWTARDERFEVVLEALEIPKGAAFALIGESGSGKSTLLDLLALTLAPDGAERFDFSPDGVNVIDVARIWRAEKRDWLAMLRAHYCGYVLQTGGLLPFLSVRDNIALPQKVSGRGDGTLIAMLAQRLGIADQLDKLPAELSVGQRQRVAIARALSHQPRLVLADEPTASVQASMAAEIMALLVEQAAKFGAALLVATHSPELVAPYRMRHLSATLEPAGARTRSVFRLEAGAALAAAKARPA